MATDAGRARSGPTSSPLGAAVARVWGRDGRPVGGAFLAAPHHLLTCAHVVNMALGAPGESTRRPTSAVMVDFPLLAPGVRLTAEVEHWVPPGTEAPEDVAGLRLVDPPPVTATPAALVEPRDTFDLRGVVLGFPALSDSGVWSIGRLRGRQARGWVQIDVDDTSQFDIRRGFSGVPVWDADRAAAVGVIVTAWRGSGIRSAYMVPAAGLFAAWPELRAMAQPPSPFPGLRAFSEAESGVFFGRQALSRRIAGLSRTAPVVTVIGPSGVGKSSLVRAGVLPQLREDSEALVVTVRPSEARTPLRSLALALDRAAAPERDAVDRLGRVSALADRLVQGGTREVVAAVLEQRGAERLLIVVDQLEEIFASSDENVDGFGRALAEAVTPGSRVRLLGALRADFLGNALKRPLLRFLVDDHRLVTVGELDDPELRQAIIGPVEDIRSVAYEEGLVSRLMDDVGYAPGRLPLVQFTLSQLWERQRDGLLTHSAYDELGGVQHALAHHAEHVWSGLDTAERAIATRLLTQLVHPLPDRISFTRRSAARTDFDDATWALAGRLATARVVVIRELEDAPRPGTDRADGAQPGARQGRTGAEQAQLGVELAHESLITRWERLDGLARQYREFRIWQDALRRRIDLWYAEGRPKRRLLPFSESREARRWTQAHPHDIGADERVYLALSRRRRRTLALRAAAVLTALALVGGVQWRSQQEKLTAGAAHSLAAGAEKLELSDGYGEAQLALRGYRTAATKETRYRMQASYQQMQSVDLLLADADTLRSQSDAVSAKRVTSVRSQVSADGRTIVLQVPDLKPAVWRLGADGRSVERLALTGGDSLIQGNVPTVDASGRRAAFVHPVGPAIGLHATKNPCSTPGSMESLPTKPEVTTCLTVYDTDSGRVALIVPVLGIARMASVVAMSVDPSAKVIGLVVRTSATAWSLQRRDLVSGRLLDARPLKVQGDELTGFWLAPGGQSATVLTLAPGSNRFTRHILTHVDLTGAKAAGPPRILARFAVDGTVAVSGDGTRIVAALAPSGDKEGTEYRIWNIRTGSQVARLSGFATTLGSAHLALDRTGQRLYASSPTYDISQVPSAQPTDVADQLEKARDITEALEEATTVRVWIWHVGESALRQTGMRLPPEWHSLRPLGDGGDDKAPLALFTFGAIGLVGPESGKTAESRLGRQPLPASSLDADKGAEHLCAALTSPVESHAVQELTPEGAADGDLCS
ncbi:AAA family ATPase [Streptomyces sp. NPDC005408]|uniref:nSTAND1 domain-containing NTPase n=1 Tax=Streptomyces sp. NPDC005408 TaxID=3155341 RepID=UPI0033AF0D82